MRQTILHHKALLKVLQSAMEASIVQLFVLLKKKLKTPWSIKFRKKQWEQKIQIVNYNVQGYIYISKKL